MCAMKPHHHCNVVLTVLRNSHCLYTCGLDQECSDIGFVHVNGDRLWIQQVCVETSSSLHRCRNLLPKLSLLPTTVVWIKNAQISVSFMSTATASGSNMRVCVETSSSLHRCRKPPPTLSLLIHLWSGSRILTYRFLSRQRRPPLDLTCVR